MSIPHQSFLRSRTRLHSLKRHAQRKEANLHLLLLERSQLLQDIVKPLKPEKKWKTQSFGLMPLTVHQRERSESK
jgi:hypothetical protein